MKHLPLIVAAILITAVFGSGAYWGGQLFRSQPGQVAVAPHTAPASPDIAAAAGLFGGAPAATATIAFKLKGVIEDGPEGVAILVEDGKPALAVGIGQQAAPGVTVTEIHRRYVMLDMSGKPTRLDLPDGGTTGLELVAAAPAPSTAPANPANPANPVNPASQGAPAMPTPSPSAPLLAANAGQVTPPANPSPRAGPPGLTNDQMRQQYEERRRQEMEQFERARRAGMPEPRPTT